MVKPSSSNNSQPTYIPNFSAALSVTFKREWLLVIRNRSEIVNPLLFFLCILIFVPLGITPNADLLSKIAPGLIWIIALLATLLSLDSLFITDFEDGTINQMQLSGQSMFWIVLCKIFVHWLVTGLPLTLLSPMLGLMLSLPSSAYLTLMASLFLGTLALSLFGAIGASLLVSLKKGGLLLSLIIMPMYVPVLVFGSAAVNNAAVGLNAVGELSVLGVIATLALILSPVAVSGAIKLSVGNQ